MQEHLLSRVVNDSIAADSQPRSQMIAGVAMADSRVGWLSQTRARVYGFGAKARGRAVPGPAGDECANNKDQDGEWMQDSMRQPGH